MSPINTTTHHLLVAILGALLIAHVSALYYVGHILVAAGATPGLWRMIKADWGWVKDHTEIKFWS